ncbi:MAG: hypothetical protein A2W19_07910 [Spirochaetes bacterium RBG_16_49_21]|nr:MAG: hypothetical protein A2W19_07910 [Spirochaetes bacterium RBG_16_49_21]
METWQTIALNLIFYTTCAQIIISLMLFLKGFSKPLLANCAALLCIVLPDYLRLNGIINTTYLFFISMLGLCSFPITCVLMIQHQHNQQRWITVLPVYITASVSFFLLMLTPDYNSLVLIVLYLFTYIYMLYMILAAKRDSQSVFLALFIFLNLTYLSVALYTLDAIHVKLSAGLTGIIVPFVLWHRLRFRLTSLMDRLNAINDLNKKLNRQIARLKQSNDTYRKIILEKDLELNQMARHASLAELTAGIAHELAQPLTGIKGMAQNMIDDINAEEFENLRAVSELLKICSLVDKSSSIIDHIRNFSKKRNTAMKTIDLNKVILDAIDLIQHQLKKNSIDLIFVLDDKIPKIRGDKISLEQLIVNIILNSKDAILEKDFISSDENGVIRITTFASNEAVSMIIEDNGSGISEDIMHKIWSPFFTTKKRDHGTGIGLSICSKILRDHNARVDIQSDDRGTQFLINFPANALRESEVQA